MSVINFKKYKHECAGQALTEFALIVPLMLFLVWGVIEFSRILFIYAEISNAAREAVRFGIARGTDEFGKSQFLDCDGIIDAAKGSLALANLDETNFTITYDHGDGVAFAACGDQPTEMQLGDRLQIQVEADVYPMIFFQDFGPLKVQFNTARTIIEQGIVMTGLGVGAEGGGAIGGGEGGDSKPMLSFAFEPACTGQGRFWWTPVTGAKGYRLYMDEIGQLNGNISGLEYPTDKVWTTVADGNYYVRAYDVYGLQGEFSNVVQVSQTICYSLTPQINLDFVDPDDDCVGHFVWDVITDSIGYTLYQGTDVLLDATDITTYPAVDAKFDDSMYSVVAFDENGLQMTQPGQALLAGCPEGDIEYAPELSYQIDESWPVCQGHLSWTQVSEAKGYKIYRGATPELIGEISGGSNLRYPTSASMVFTDGDSYYVAGFNNEDTGPLSAPVTVQGCGLSNPVNMELYLQTSWPSDIFCVHHDGPPTLSMGERKPFCHFLYDYDGDETVPFGRMVDDGGAAPWENLAQGESDPHNYLAWLSRPLEKTLLIDDPSLTIWYHTEGNSLGYVYFCSYIDDIGYGYCQSAKIGWKASPGWQAETITFSDVTVQAGSRLAVYLNIIAGKAPVWFVYDKKAAFPSPAYDSKLFFIGQWQEP